MARWTEEDIRVFWKMKREGASLIDIADRLGRNYTAVATYASKQKNKVISKEDTKMEVETNNTTHEITTEVNASVVAPEAPAMPKLDITIQQTLAMIRSQGLAFDCMHMSLSDGGATLELHFARR